MSVHAWHVRVANVKDRALLRGFECADKAAPWSVDVERVIQMQLLDWALAPGAAKDDPRIVLVFDRHSNDVVGLAAHERAVLVREGGDTFDATKLYVLAVSRHWQGRSFESGQRASDVVMNAVMKDISSREPPRDARVYGTIDEGNKRSIHLCKRHGLVHELEAPPHHVRLITEHRPR
jgi:hypothetical protein